MERRNLNAHFPPKTASLLHISTHFELLLSNLPPNLKQHKQSTQKAALSGF